jgi:ABC-type dipeptide/oligopeptide/nickel transport system permease component
MSERINGLYELKQTCHFTMIQITALRIIAYSLVGFMLTILMLVFSTRNGDEFLLLFSLCLFSLSICVTSSLLLIRLFQGKWTFAIFSSAWITLNGMIPFLVGIEKWENLLRAIPTTIAFILAVFGCLLFVYRLNKIFTEVKNYVNT